MRAEGRFVRERDAAIASLLDERPMSGETLEVEVREGVGLGRTGRPDITILWENAAAGRAPGSQRAPQASVDPRSRTAISDAARAKGLSLETMGETRLWKLLGVPS